MDEQNPPVQSNHRSRRPVLREVMWGGIAAIVSTLLAAWMVGAPGSLRGLWERLDLSIMYSMARELATHVLPSPNQDLAFPFGQDLSNFPSPDLINLAEIKALVMTVGDPLMAVNLYLILSFALVAVSQYALLRVVRIPPMLATALAISFTMVPWHFVRFTHATAANYSSVSVGLILVVAVLSWPLALSGPDRAPKRILVLTLTLTVYVGLSFTYYAAFISLLALVGLAFQVMLGRRGRVLISAVWFAILPTLITVGAALLYRATSIAGATVPLGRAPEDSQYYGGAIFTLLRTTDLWTSGWPIPGLNLVPTLADRLEADARNSTVGVAAVVIAFLTAGLVLAANGRDRRAGLVASLGYWPWLFLVSVLFFSSGAFGQVSSIFFGNLIRSWGRFSIVAIAIAYLILGLTISYALERSRRRRVLEIGASMAVVGITVLDLLSMPAPIDGATANREADVLRDYGRQLDTALPEGCGVFTMPAYLFPDGATGDPTPNDDPLLPYLFSQNSRWSYGGVRGSHGGQWSFDDVSRDVPTLVQQVTAAGFCAIQVDTAAFVGDTSPEAELRGLLGGPVATSTDGRWVTYSLAGAAAGSFRPDYVLNPVTIAYGSGFAPATAAGSAVHAALLHTQGTLSVRNPRLDAVSGRVEAEVAAPGCPAGSRVTVATPTSSTTVPTTAQTSILVPVTVGAATTVSLQVSGPGGCEVVVVNPRFIPD